MSGHGMRGHVGLGKQSAWGTPVAVTDYAPIMSENVQETRDRFDVENVYGGVHEPDDQAGVRRVAGDITFAVNPETIGHFLQGALGTVSVTSIETNLAASAFTPRATDASSLHPLDVYTFEIFRDVGSSQQYSDCQITALEFNVAPNQALMAKASVIGRMSTNIEATTPTFVSSPTEPFTFDSASLAIGGTATSLVEGVTINISNNIEARPSLNNSNIAARMKRSGPVQIRVSGNVGFEDITEYNAFLNQTERSMVLNFFEAASFSLNFNMSRFSYDAFPLGMGGREFQLVGFEGRAKYNVSSATALLTTLTTVNSEW